MNMYLLILLAEQGSTSGNFESWVMGIIAVLVTASIAGLIRVYAAVQNLPEQLTALSVELGKLNEKLDNFGDRINTLERKVGVLEYWQERMERDEHSARNGGG